MDRQTVLLADADVEFALLLREVLEAGGFAVVLAQDGSEALRLAREQSPALLVIDAVLPRLDGLSVLRSLRRDGCKTPTVLTSAFLSAGVLEAANALCADFFLPKSFVPEALLEHLRALSRGPKSGEAGGTFSRSGAALLHTLGVPTRLKGYRYALDAAQLIRDDPALLQALTKAVYPTVARDFRTTALCVERSLRHAIEVAYAHGDVEIWQQYFGKLCKQKPTNGAFLALLAEQMRAETGGAKDETGRSVAN